jgi:DNA-binding NarL/FixJ family response regulator
MVVDDHQLIINGLVSLIEDEPDIRFCGGANNWDEAFQVLQMNNIDVALVDINLPGKSGVEITREIKKEFPKTRVLALSMHENFVMIQKMISAGAAGYILKSSNQDEVLEAIRLVFSKGSYLGNDVQNILMEGIKLPVDPESSAREISLSKREQEVLVLVAKEYSNEEIAEKLFISERTVESHRRNILIKTKTKSVVGLIKYAIQNNLISQENR